MLQKLGWLNERMSSLPVAVEIIWICAFFDLLLFGVVGLVVAAAGQVFPKFRKAWLSVFVFVFLTVFDWLSLTGYIAFYGAFLLALGVAVRMAGWFRRHEAAAFQFGRKTIPWVAAASVLALAGIQAGLWWTERRAIAGLPPASPGLPNILVIVVDALRADHLSTFGYPRPTSPNVDRIAREGVAFENAFATSSWTLPSLASLLTGRYPHQHGAERQRLDRRHPTIAEEFRAFGYRTGAFSANPFIFCRGRGLERGFIRFEDYFHSPSAMAWRTLYGRKIRDFASRFFGFEELPGRKRASAVNRAVLEWIDRDPGRPFFTFVNYFDTHDPYLPPAPYRRRFSESTGPGIGDAGTCCSQESAPAAQAAMDAYDGAIAYVDDEIRLLLAELDRRDVRGNLLVVMTSDHGESFGDHGRFKHGSDLYRESIRVPLIFCWPGRIPAGLRITRPVSTASLPATLTELAGVGERRQLPGPSLVQFWKGNGVDPDWPYPLSELAYFPEAQANVPAARGRLRSLVSPRWHYIVHEKSGVELYDWTRDPGEVQNLAATPEGRRAASELAAYLENLLGQR